MFVIEEFLNEFTRPDKKWEKTYSTIKSTPPNVEIDKKFAELQLIDKKDIGPKGKQFNTQLKNVRNANSNSGTKIEKLNKLKDKVYKTAGQEYDRKFR